MRVHYCLALTLFLIVSGISSFAQDKPLPRLKLDSRRVSESFQDSAKPSDKPLGTDQAKERRERAVAASRMRRRLQWEKNAAYWRDEIEKDPGEKFYYRHLLYALRQIDRCEEIFEVADEVLRIDPLDAYSLSTAGFCRYERGQYDKAIDYLQPSVWYNPSSFETQRELGYCFYRLRRYLDAAAPLEQAVRLRPNDFGSNYWLGCSLMNCNNYTDAVEPLAKAARVRPSDFWANHWSGSALLRVGRYHEAIANLEKAIALRKDATQTRILLFTAYVATGEFTRASGLFPIFSTIMAVALTGAYLIGLLPLLFFSFRRSASDYPNVLLSVGWLIVFMEGQIAFIFLLAQIPWLKLIANPLGAVLLSGLPLLAAVTGLGRQRWGEPWRWPLRFGGARVVLISMLLLIGSYFCNFLLAQVAHSDRPLQNTIPIFKEALHNSPWITYLIMAVGIPAIEEVLFRGLLFGSMRRWFSPTWSVIGTALIFAAFHLQPAAFIQLFLLGCLLGWARARSGSVALPILLHVLNNSLAVVGLLSGKV